MKHISGKLEINASISLRLLIEVNKDSNGYSANLISIDQGNAKIPANSTVVNGNDITVDFTAIGAKYSATIGDTALNGVFNQAGQEFPLELKKVIAEENLTAIKSALKECDNRDYTIKEYPNLNHLFQKCKTGAIPEYSQIQETINPEVLQDITKWILGL